MTQEFNTYESAVYLFKDKYDGLPGDMLDAQSYWGAAADCTTAQTTSATCNGNGDNVVDNNPPSGTRGNENALFWKHLTNAGLIEGNYTGVNATANPGSSDDANVPSSHVTGGLWYATYLSTSGSSSRFDGDFGNILQLGMYVSNSSPYQKIFSPSELWSIDKKSDDGKPGTGKIIARWYATCAVKADGVTPATNTDALTALYNLSNTDDPQCSVFFSDTW